ncbi:esterase/lipase family protein [Streptacidiphilus sp. EB129]|uniref:esterase/lipase family protein n=1 Tax=Streptacidiphilus sp. EB129 TaxID=3156262 RepID=UPI0035192B6B
MSHSFCRAAVAASIEAAALAGHLLLYPTGIRSERWPLPAADCEHRTHAPVLLLHGLFDNRAVFTQLRRSLRGHGWQHVHALNYSPVTVDIPSAAELLGRHVLHTRKVYGGERVAVVGHSLGGLIARYYVQHLDGAEHVHTVVTIATPHEGTRLAGLLRPLPIARQLQPDSSVFARLRAPAPNCDTRFVAFWGDLDPLILPRTGAQLLHPDLRAENVLVAGSGHVTLPLHPLVIRGVRDALSTPPWERRTAIAS